MHGTCGENFLKQTKIIHSGPYDYPTRPAPRFVSVITAEYLTSTDLIRTNRSERVSSDGFVSDNQARNTVEISINTTKQTTSESVKRVPFILLYTRLPTFENEISVFEIRIRR